MLIKFVACKENAIGCVDKVFCFVTTGQNSLCSICFKRANALRNIIILSSILKHLFNIFNGFYNELNNITNVLRTIINTLQCIVNALKMHCNGIFVKPGFPK